MVTEGLFYFFYSEDRDAQGFRGVEEQSLSSLQQTDEALMQSLPQTDDAPVQTPDDATQRKDTRKKEAREENYRNWGKLETTGLLHVEANAQRMREVEQAERVEESEGDEVREDNEHEQELLRRRLCNLMAAAGMSL